MTIQVGQRINTEMASVYGCPRCGGVIALSYVSDSQAPSGIKPEDHYDHVDRNGFVINTQCPYQKR